MYLIKEYVNLITNFFIIFCVLTAIYLNANIGHLPPVICVVILEMFNSLLLFDCEHVKTIWRQLSRVLHFDIQWKHVILGFSFEWNVKTHFLVTLLSFVAHNI